ncbi:MAG: hypothetical protein R3E96_02160 [Planctomycetota bacterium]
MAAAGRELFAVSRAHRSSQNDGDRLRKFLGRFGLSATDFSGVGGPGGMIGTPGIRPSAEFQGFL